jgi:hypothetical protein
MQSISSSSIHNATPSGETIYLGSPQSRTLLRIYDKRLESQAKQREDWQEFGIRWELAHHYPESLREVVDALEAGRSFSTNLAHAPVLSGETFLTC